MATKMQRIHEATAEKLEAIKTHMNEKGGYNGVSPLSTPDVIHELALLYIKIHGVKGSYAN